MYRKYNYPTLRVFILDEFAIVVAFVCAYLMRFPFPNLSWQNIWGGVYLTLVATLGSFHGIVFLVYDKAKKSIFEQDPVENMMTIIKSRCILIALSFLYLFVIQRIQESSRTVIMLFFALSIVFDYLFRMLYRRYHLRKYGHLMMRKVLTIEAPYPDDQEFIRRVSEQDYDDVIICDSPDDTDGRIRLVKAAEKAGIRVFCTVHSMGYTVRTGIITNIGEYAAIPVAIRPEKFPLFGVNYSICKTEEAVLHVIRHVRELAGRYICFSNVHTSVMARENKDYAGVLNGAAFTFPDGNPVAVLQKKHGIVGSERVAGPDFMEHMFKNTTDGSITHYFYGSSQKTLDALKENLEKKYPGLVIKGLYSPPFRELTPEEDRADVEMINEAGADIIWIGLGAPKQEKWMQAHEGKVNGIMMGVGAGFDFHAGTIKRAPLWIQKTGFEWLYRLFQDPGRLIRRYVVTNIKFFWYLGIDTLKETLR